MNGKEIITLADAPPVPLPISRAVKAGSFVFVSGMGGRRDPVSGKWGGIEEQLRNSLERIGQVLEAAGSSLDNVVSVTVCLKRPEDFQTYNEIYRSYFRQDFPARLTIIADQPDPEKLVEIACVAVVPSS